MKNFFLTLIFIATIFSVKAQVTADLHAGQKIEWMTLEQAFAATQKEPRKIMVDVYTGWCGWCKVMDQKTFMNDRVANFVKRFKTVNRFFRLFRVHSFLRFIHYDNRLRFADHVNIRRVVEQIFALLTIDDFIIADNRAGRHHHYLRMLFFGKLSDFVKFFAAVFKIIRLESVNIL